MSISWALLIFYLFIILDISLYSVLYCSRPDDRFVYAGFWARLAAQLVDIVVMVFCSLVIMVGMIVFLKVQGIDGHGKGAQVMPFQLLASGVAWWLYCAVMESSSHQGTFGKMLLRIKVVDLQGEGLDFGTATARFAARFLSVLPLFFGYVMIGLSKKKQCLHDRLALTLVIHRAKDDATQKTVDADTVGLDIARP